MKNLSFCPNCGEKTINWDMEKKWSCNKCSFVLYNNVAGAVAVVIRCGNEIFLTRRNQDPKKGKLDMAGGFIDPKESAETTCERELFEELKLKIDTSKLKYLASLPNIYQYKEIDYNTIDLFFEYEVDTEFDVDLELSEISDAVWIPLNQLDLEDLAFDSQKNFMKDYLKS